MIPIAAKGANGDNPESLRRVLYVLNDWEIVLFKAYTKAYAVHSCKAEAQHTKATVGDDPLRPGPPRAIIKAAVLKRGMRNAIICWCCDAAVPDEIITITELFNG